jgi:putative endonuclease
VPAAPPLTAVAAHPVIQSGTGRRFFFRVRFLRTRRPVQRRISLGFRLSWVSPWISPVTEESPLAFSPSHAKIRRVDRTSHVYILASKSAVLYTGVTSNLNARISQHKSAHIPGFTKKYHVNRLVWLEPHNDIRAAIAREKQIKGLSRTKKIALIESLNPTWQDLSETF